jgi:hypothetical protein
MVKKTIFIFLLAITGFCPSPARGNAVGFILGEPTGFRFQLDIKPKQVMNFGLGWGFYNRYYYPGIYHTSDFRLNITGDYVLLFPDPLKINQPYDLYAGLGAILRTDWDLFLGVRIPLGVQVRLGTLPVDAFLEFAPGMTIIANTDPFLTAGLGITFHFDKLKK